MISHWKFTDKPAFIKWKAKPLDGEDSESLSPLAVPSAMIRMRERGLVLRREGHTI